jgi:hypothetical protein
MLGDLGACAVKLPPSRIDDMTNPAGRHIRGDHFRRIFFLISGENTVENKLIFDDKKSPKTILFSTARSLAAE